MMELRRLTQRDLNSYFENRLRALQNAPTAFLTTYVEEKARGSNHFSRSICHEGNERAIFGAVNNEIIIGAVGIYKEDRPKTNHKAIVWGMYVDEGQRNQGLGGRLLDLAIQFAKNQMNVSGIYLSVESANSSAKNLYLSKGFAIWGTEPRAMTHEGQFYDEHHMVLLL